MLFANSIRNVLYWYGRFEFRKVKSLFFSESPVFVTHGLKVNRARGIHQRRSLQNIAMAQESDSSMSASSSGSV